MSKKFTDTDGGNSRALRMLGRVFRTSKHRSGDSSRTSIPTTSLSDRINTVAACTAPPEIIRAIFSLVSFAQRLRASATCRYWREVLLAFSELWADPCLRGNIYLHNFLNRSGTQPLFIRIRHDGGFRINLNAHARHVASINIDFDFRANAVHASELLTAPSYLILRELIVSHLGFPHLKAITLPLDAPNLRTLILRGFGIPLTLGQVFSGLRELVLLGEGSQRVHSEAFEILANIPQLEVYLVRIDNRRQAYTAYTGELLLVPRLRRLGIRLTERGRENDNQLYAPIDPTAALRLQHSTWNVGQPQWLYQNMAFDKIYVTSRRVQLFDPTIDLHLGKIRPNGTEEETAGESPGYCRLLEQSLSCASNMFVGVIHSSAGSLRSLCLDTFVAQRPSFTTVWHTFPLLEELSLRDAAHARLFDDKSLSGFGFFHSTMPALKTFRFIASNWLDLPQRITGLRQPHKAESDRTVLSLGRFMAVQRKMGMRLQRFVVCGIPYTAGAQETLEGRFGGEHTEELIWEDAEWTPELFKLDRWDEELVRG